MLSKNETGNCWRQAGIICFGNERTTNAAAPHFSDANCGLLRKWRPKTVPLDRALHSTHSRAHISSPSVAAEFGNSLKNECAQIFSVVVSRLLCPDSAMMMTTMMMMMMPVSNPTRSAVERRRLPRNPVFAAYPPSPVRRPPSLPKIFVIRRNALCILFEGATNLLSIHPSICAEWRSGGGGWIRPRYTCNAVLSLMGVLSRNSFLS